MIDKEKYIGEENYNQHGTLMKIIRSNGYSDIDVEFQDEHKYVAEHMRYDYFREGRLQNPFDKTVYGVGYLGKNYITSDNIKAYQTWNGMLERCYDKKYKDKKPTYIGCYVCDEWLNYSVFKKWFEENIYEIENDQIHIDKDILKKGNKCYCPQYCILVPRRINSLFTNGTNVRGDLPIGVTLDRTTYRARLSTLEGRIDLGHFKNPNEAFNAYKIAKEKYIKQIADEYKDKIPKKLYDAMYNWKVEITD